MYIYLLISSKSLFNPCFLKKNGKKYENLRKLFNLMISMQIIHKKIILKIAIKIFKNVHKYLKTTGDQKICTKNKCLYL